MQAVILKTPVSSWKVAGLTLVERARRAARKAGAREVLVTDRLEAVADRLRGATLLIEGDTVFEMEAVETAVKEARLEGARDEDRRAITIPSNLLWRITDRQALREAEGHLKRTLYRALRVPTENWVLRNINRPLSRWITYGLVRTPLTPNQISVLVALLTLVIARLLANADPVSLALAGLLFQFRSILDCCDGEVARLKLAWSKRGQWVDTVSDNASYLIFLAGVSVGATRQGFSLALPMALIVFAGALLTLSLMYFYLIRYTNSGSLLTVDADWTQDARQLSRHRGVRWLLKVKFLMKKDYFSLLFAALCLAGRLDVILILSAIGANLSWLVLVTIKREFARVILPAEREG